MRILAIESSGRESSVAALEGSDTGARLLNELPVTGPGRTAQALAPTIKQLQEAVEWPPGSIELVAVTVGPGSFTGLRIGVTTAKTLAYGTGAQVIGVDTLAVLALQATENQDRRGLAHSAESAEQIVPVPFSTLWTVLDAHRQELFAAKFQIGDRPLFSTQTDAPPTDADREKGTVPLPVCTVQTHIVPVADWLAQLRPGDLVTGPAVPRLQSQLPAGVEMADPAYWQPTSVAVGRVAWREYQAGHRDDLWKLVPKYYRPSAAEEKRARS